MEGTSLDIVQDLINQLKQVVPQAFTENKLDTDYLKTLLGEGNTADGERYALTWAGKAEAYKVLQTATTTTLNPEPDKSIQWDETENVLIEGENLEVLKVLQKSYYNKVKMIYIDPPYNTGNDSFIYPDKFSESKEDYLKRVGDKDDEGLMMREGFFRKNSKENGQYHSNWLNMMLPRLFLARNMLKEGGVIFVSIDDNEQANLKLLMDEIFGAENQLGQIIWKKKTNGNNVGYIPPVHDYILAYSRRKDLIIENNFGFPISQEYINKNYSNPDNDPRGLWNTMDLSANHKGPHFPITNPETQEVHYPSEGRYWVFNSDEVLKRISEGRIIFGKSGTGKPVQKVFLKERQERRIKAESWWDKHGMNEDGTAELTELFKTPKLFDHSKPSVTIKHLINIATCNSCEDLVLDFFAGSGTTAQAILELNEKDQGNRKFICVQLPEQTEPSSEALKAGFNTVADITQERIKRVIEKIEKTRNGSLELDKRQPLGFRKFKLEGSNFKIWRGDVATNEEELKQQMELFTVPQRANATTENMLWELLVKSGFPLTEKVKTVTLPDGEVMYLTGTLPPRLVVVLDSFTQAVQDEILTLKPKAVLCLDSLFTGRDNDKTNAQLKFEDNGILFKTI